MSARATLGFGLVEILLAVTLSVLLCLAISNALVRYSRAYRALEAEVRLEDAARLALDTLEADLRMAGFWGLIARTSQIQGTAVAGQPTPATYSAVESANLQACGGPASNWAIDLSNAVDGSDGTYTFACRPYANAAPGSDVLVVRRAESNQVTRFDPDRLHIASHPLLGQVFVPAAGCNSLTNPACWPTGLMPESAEARSLVVRAYYVDTQSTQRSDVPSLRRKVYSNVHAATTSAAVYDEEIVAGVEDLQLQWGTDTDADGSVDAYVAPGAVPAGARVLSIALWLRMRADEPEPQYQDDRSYRYGSMAAAYRPRDHYRRLVISRTIRLRNAE